MYNIYMYILWHIYVIKSEDYLLGASCTVALFWRMIVADMENARAICKAALLSLHGFRMITHMSQGWGCGSVARIFTEHIGRAGFDLLYLFNLSWRCSWVISAVGKWKQEYQKVKVKVTLSHVLSSRPAWESRPCLKRAIATNISHLYFCSWTGYSCELS